MARRRRDLAPEASPAELELLAHRRRGRLIGHWLMLDADMVSPAGRAILDRASELQGQGVPASQQVEALLQLYEAYGLADMARRQLAAADSEERTHA